MYLDVTQPQDVLDAIQSMSLDPQQLVLLLIAEHTLIDVDELVNLLSANDINFAGAIFTGVIYGQNRYEKGIVIEPLSLLAQPIMIHGLESTQQSFEISENIRDYIKSATHAPTAMVFVDGLSQHIDRFMNRLFSQLSNHVTYLGGGAGSLSLEQMPCVFDTTGIYQDSALLILLDSQTALGIRHGWEDVRGPYIATKTDNTVVLELDGKPAFDVYSKIINMVTGNKLNKDNFFDIAKAYPLGIFHRGMDRIVRDPITFTDDGGLVCVGNIPGRSLMYILHGNNRNLIENAKRAAHEALKLTSNAQQLMVVDCISRVLYLEDEFTRELINVQDALPDHSASIFGVLSLGEIGTYETGRVEFFNKTIVVGALSDLNSNVTLSTGVGVMEQSQ